jgi:hypothetical protein
MTKLLIGASMSNQQELILFYANWVEAYRKCL